MREPVFFLAPPFFAADFFVAVFFVAAFFAVDFFAAFFAAVFFRVAMVPERITQLPKPCRLRRNGGGAPRPAAPR